jgi:septal ring-binding cell division protein DamX
LGVLCLPCVLHAQTPTRGKVEVDKDPKVDSLIGNYLVGSKGGNNNNSSDGFRVQIYSSSNRKDAYSVQAKFQDKYPDVRTYLTYRDPNFKVHVGDYRSRLEAEKMVAELKPIFAGLFIVEEKINLPKLDTE